MDKARGEITSAPVFDPQSDEYKTYLSLMGTVSK